VPTTIILALPPDPKAGDARFFRHTFCYFLSSAFSTRPTISGAGRRHPGGRISVKPRLLLFFWYKIMRKVLLWQKYDESCNF